jgi:hypothetical protein
MNDSGAPDHGRLGKAKEFVVDELRRYLVSFLYIYVLLGMFTMHEEIALRTHGGVAFAPHGFALVNALVLGKVALIVEDLRLGHRIKPTPLIWPIVLESLMLAVLFIAMHVLEHVIGGWLHGESLAASVPAIGGGGALGLFFSATSFFVAMLPFCAFRIIANAIGMERVWGLLFGTASGERR